MGRKSTVLSDIAALHSGVGLANVDKQRVESWLKKVTDRLGYLTERDGDVYKAERHYVVSISQLWP